MYDDDDDCDWKEKIMKKMTQFFGKASKMIYITMIMQGVYSIIYAIVNLTQYGQAVSTDYPFQFMFYPQLGDFVNIGGYGDRIVDAWGISAYYWNLVFNPKRTGLFADWWMLAMIYFDDRSVGQMGWYAGCLIPEIVLQFFLFPLFPELDMPMIHWYAFFDSLSKKRSSPAMPYPVQEVQVTEEVFIYNYQTDPYPFPTTNLRYVDGHVSKK